MLYLDYYRKAGEWIPNEYGGHENIEAIAFLPKLNELSHCSPRGPPHGRGVDSLAGVSRPTYLGGLGFSFKWNMGWMNDTLELLPAGPGPPGWHHHELTFACSTRSTRTSCCRSPTTKWSTARARCSQDAGRRWQKFANLRMLLSWMWAHPGRQVLFHGRGDRAERRVGQARSVDWHLLQWPEHAGLQHLVRVLNRHYRD